MPLGHWPWHIGSWCLLAYTLPQKKCNVQKLRFFWGRVYNPNMTLGHFVRICLIIFNLTLRQHSLYSLVHESRRVFQPCRRKKDKKKNFTSKIFFLVRYSFQILPIFVYRNTTDLVKKSTLFDMSDEKMNKNHSIVRFLFSSGTFWARRRNRGPQNIVSVALY